jgi:RTX calcium-binding nonapeptide repeat (4 copies)
VHTGDDVLWFFENTETGENTGDELAIDAPARARPGEPVDVTVSAYSFDGKRKPAAAATVVAGSGGRTTSDGGGRARVSFSQQGYLKLRASLGSDIPSPVLKVCVSARLARCAPVRGKRIYGTGLSDRVRGTAGRDVVRTGAGDDVINVRGGRLDRVFCGRGTDLVRASRKDHVASDCEEVRRR